MGPGSRITNYKYKPWLLPDRNSFTAITTNTLAKHTNVNMTHATQGSQIELDNILFGLVRSVNHN